MCATTDPVLSEDRWQEAMLALYQDKVEASSMADGTILLGGFNVSGLAVEVMAGHNSES